MRKFNEEGVELTDVEAGSSTEHALRFSVYRLLCTRNRTCGQRIDRGQLRLSRNIYRTEFNRIALFAKEIERLLRLTG